MKHDCPVKQQVRPVQMNNVNLPVHPPQFPPLRYVMVTLDGKPVRALLDGGAQCCAVLKTLVPPLPDDVPTLRNYSIHGSGNNPFTRVTISASGITHDVESLV